MVAERTYPSKAKLSRSDVLFLSYFTQTVDDCKVACYGLRAMDQRTGEKTADQLTSAWKQGKFRRKSASSIQILRILQTTHHRHPRVALYVLSGVPCLED